MIDVHCHLNFHAFEKDYDVCITRALEKGITHIINVGTKLDSSQKAIKLAEKYKNLFAIVGVHPHHADKEELTKETKEPEGTKETKEKGVPGIRKLDLNNDWISKLEKLAKHPKVVAIGEIGLDYYSYKSNGIVDKQLQKDVFETQLQLAHELHLPIQIHNRHAGEDILEILTHHKNLLKGDTPGMFHCFAASREIHKKILDLGFCIGFDGNSTYPGLAPGETVLLSELIKLTPLDRIVTETDSPFLTPIPYRRSRNEPSYVILVGEFIAQIKGMPFEEIDRITTENAKRLFNLNVA